MIAVSPNPGMLAAAAASVVPQLGAAPAPGPGRPLTLYILAGLSVILVALGVGLVVWWLRLRRRRDASNTAILNPAQSIPRARLRSIWDKFLSRLPAPVRVAVPECSHFVVFGNTGSGKSALIGRRVDWQGQASQFIPSFTADPLLQIYLGSRTVVEELSAVLQDATSRGYNEALKNLWKNLEVDQVPTVVIVLSAPILQTSSPDQIRQQAQLLRGKINVLSECCGGSARVRICISHMDRVRGYTDLARFLCKQRLPLVLDLGTEAGSDLSAGLLRCERYLPRALTTVPVSSFESIIEFLRSADQILQPLVSFVQALSEGSVASLRPEVQRVYFSSLGSDEQIGNPFEPPPQQRSTALGSRLARLLRPFGIAPLHALLGLCLLALGVGAVSLVTRRHRGLVDSAAEAGLRFEQAVERARTAQSSGESDVVRRAEQRTSQALTQTSEAEARFRPLRLIYRPDKRDNERRFVDALRRGYLQPALERALRQRSRDRILSALAALYATRDNTLGTLIRAQLVDWSIELGVPRDTLLDYIRYSAEPWSEVALIALPPLPLDAARFPITDLAPWRSFLAGITQAVKRPFVTPEELSLLQRESGRLGEALVQIRKAGLLRQLYRNLAEESPLNMVKLFGQDVGALSPSPWLTDHKEPLDRVLHMVSESSIRVEQADGTRSLYQLLRWLNESSPPGATGSAALPAASVGDEDLVRFLFPGESASYDVSRREWLELLLRSRRRTFSLSDLSGRSDRGSERELRSRKERGSSSCERRRRRHPSRSRSCSEVASYASASGSGERRSPERGQRALPLWSQEEFTPKLAALLTSGELPAMGLSEIYNRSVYQREVLPLVQELKRALGASKNLSAEQKIALARRVQSELADYSRRYCAALLDYHLGYRISGRSSGHLHSELLDLVKPGSPFVARLQTVVDNATLTGLDEPYLRPLASCLADFRPIVDLLAPKAPAPPGAAPPAAQAAKSPPGAADKKDAPDGKAAPAATPPAAAPAEAAPPPAKPEGLAEYNEAVAQLIADLDRASGGAAPAAGGAAPAAGGAADRSAALAAKLSPIGRSALLMHEGADASPLRKAEQFLDRAGIGGTLRRPFLAPFLAVYQSGAGEIERVLASHWRDAILSQVEQILGRFPFNRAAEREVAPAELDVLSEKRGTIFNDLRGLYAPALSESGGVWTQRSAALGTLRLPRDLLPTVNRLAKLSRALFAPDGNRQPLVISIRGLPGPQVQDGRAVQPALAFLQVGKTAAYGFNQKSSALPLSIEWWAQGAAVVGVENVSPESGRKQTQTLEVADSAWSLFRLLQRSTLDGSGVSTWRIVGDSPEETRAIRFVLNPDPWELFDAPGR